MLNVKKPKMQENFESISLSLKNSSHNSTTKPINIVLSFALRHQCQYFF